MSNLAPCSYQDKCSGCSFWPLPLETQRQNKIHDFTLRLGNHSTFRGPLQCLGSDLAAVRDRLDFTFKNGRLGLYGKDKASRELVDIHSCAVATAPLNKALNELRQIQWPFQLASLRLRVGPQGQKGLWIDCANVDVKKLLSSLNPLRQILDLGFTVEIGQKGKSPVWKVDRWKLEAQNPEVFFLTWNGDKEIPLRTPVSSFTQPGKMTNRYLISAIQELLKGTQVKRAIEFGAGIGNLSFPLLEFAENVYAYEFDEAALQALGETLKDLPEYQSRLHLVSGDFQNRLEKKTLNTEGELALVNPPRSGLKDFANFLNGSPKIEKLIYVSCFPESFFSDLKAMESHFVLDKVTLVDQFPMTSHYEIVALLKRVQS